MSKVSDAEKFALNFFTQLNNALDKKYGGKRQTKSKGKGKRKVGGVKDALFPVPLTAETISQVRLLKKRKADEMNNVEMPPRSKFNIRVVPSRGMDVNAELSQHMSAALQGGNLELTPEEVFGLSTYVQVSSLLPEVKEAAAVASQSWKSLSPVIDEGNLQSIQVVNQLLEEIPGQSSVIEKQVSVLESITEHSIEDIETMVQSYQNPVEFSRQTTSTFLNLFGRLAALFSLLLCYKDRLITNPVVKSLYSCVSFVLFCIYKVFLVLINYKIGQAFLLFVLADLYKQNNTVAVFIVNLLLKLVQFADRRLGVSAYLGHIITDCILPALPAMLTSVLSHKAVDALVSSTLGIALRSPEVSQFADTLVGSLSQTTRQTLEQSLPVLTQKLMASPEVLQAITKGVTLQLGPELSAQLGPQLMGAVTDQTNIMAKMMPALIEGVTSEMKGTIAQSVETVTTTITHNMAANAAGQQITKSLTDSVSNFAITQGIKWAGYYLTGDPNVGSMLTNGGKRTKKHKLKSRRR